MIQIDFFKAIKARLTSEVTDLKYFDWFNNQFEKIEEDVPFNLPAAFIEFAPIDWQQLGRLHQAAEVNFLIHVADMQLGESSSIDPDLVANANLAHLELCDKIYAALQNFNGNMVNPALPFSSICRTGNTMDHDNEGLVITAIPFRVRLFEAVATPPVTVKNLAADITANVDEDLNP